MPQSDPMNSPRLRASLETLTLAVTDSDELKTWFLKLGELPSNLRMNAILQITTEMRHADEDPALIDAIAALCNAELYDSVKAVILDEE
jgi:hypothetical protein